MRAGIMSTARHAASAALSAAPANAKGPFAGWAGDGTAEAVPSPASKLTVIAGDVGPQWPEEPDLTPIWRTAAEERAAAIGLRLPSYRTRRAFEAAVALCAERVEAAQLSPAEAATAFLAHVRRAKQTETVVYSNGELTEAYRAFGAGLPYGAPPENLMRAELKRLPGVRRETITRHAPRRVREVVWTICNAPAVRRAVA